jgi:dTDP-D-glucose 4,6-dehydratase
MKLLVTGAQDSSAPRLFAFYRVTIRPNEIVNVDKLTYAEAQTVSPRVCRRRQKLEAHKRDAATAVGRVWAATPERF